MVKRQEPSLVRASDMALWSFCQRAWWLARVQGTTHQHPGRLAHGVTFHETHGHTLQRAQQFRQWAYRLLALALMLSGLLLLFWLWQSG